MPTERAAILAGIVIGILFGTSIVLMDYKLNSAPPQVTLVIDGRPHYGALRTYDWSSSGTGGGGHYVGKVPEAITVQNGSEISVRASWDRRLVELSCVQIKDNPCIIYKQRGNTFAVNLEEGQYRLYVMTIWSGRLSERVLFEYQVNVTQSGIARQP